MTVPAIRRRGSTSHDWNIIDPVSLRARVSVQQGLVAWAEGDRGPVYPPLAAADVHVGVLRCKVQEAQVRLLGAVLHASLGNRTDFEGDAAATESGRGSVGSELAARNASVATMVQRVQSATTDAGQLLGLDIGGTNRVLQVMNGRQIDAVPTELRQSLGLRRDIDPTAAAAGTGRVHSPQARADAEGSPGSPSAPPSARSKGVDSWRGNKKQGRRWYEAATRRQDVSRRRRRRVSSAAWRGRAGAGAAVMDDRQDGASRIGGGDLPLHLSKWVLPPVPAQSRGRLWLRYVSLVC